MVYVRMELERNLQFVKRLLKNINPMNELSSYDFRKKNFQGWLKEVEINYYLFLLQTYEPITKMTPVTFI